MSASTSTTGGVGSVGTAGISAVAGVTFGVTVSAVAGVMFTLTVISRWRSESKKWESGTPVTYLFQQVTGQ